MGLFQKLFNPQKDVVINESIPITNREILDSSSKKDNSIKAIFVKYATFLKSYSDTRERIIAPEFNLLDIYKASITDSYVKMALSKYKSLIYKAGYQLKSENDKAISYLKQRFNIFSITSGKPMDILLQEIGDDLITYSNSFVIKSRSDQITYPGFNVTGVFDDKPVSGYYRLDPCYMFIKTNKHGVVEKYIYRTSGGEQTFSPKDVIHFYIDRDPDNKFGTPRIIAALEDVKLLRRIEGNIMSLIYRFSMPTYHWTVGLPADGKGGTDSEINEMKNAVGNMDIDGCIITNERVKATVIGSEGQALDASKYLDYFEKRVFAALGVSESQMGRGGAKQDADSMESQLHDYIKYVQRHISIFVEMYIFSELLLEGGFNPISNENDYVYCSFNEISLDTKIKVENHELAKFQGNITTFDEARRAIGLRTDSVDESSLYVNMVTNDSAIKQINAKVNGEIKVAKAASKLGADTNESSNEQNGSNTAINNNITTKTSTIKGNGTQKSATNGSNGTIKSINTPTNQHGTTSVRIKESLESIKNISPERAYLREKYKNIYELYQNIKDSIVINKSDSSFIIPICFNKMANDVAMIMKEQFINGAKALYADLDKDYTFVYDEAKMNQIVEMCVNSINDISRDILADIKTNNDIDNIITAFDKYGYRIDYVINYHLSKAHNCGYVSTARLLDIDTVNVQFNSELDSLEHNSKINTYHYDIHDIPAYHPFCKCSVSIK